MIAKKRNEITQAEKIKARMYQGNKNGETTLKTNYEDKVSALTRHGE
jgi:hypothetical protein